MSTARPTTGPASAVAALASGRRLLVELVKRDVQSRYRGSLLGALWSLAQPLMMLGIYTVVFTQVLPTRWPGAERPLDFALLLFVGLILHGFLADVMNRAPAMVLSNPNFVRKVVFPLELLPASLVGSALFQLALATLALAIFILIGTGSLRWSIVLFPLVALPLALVALGVAWFLASLGVYLRDIAQIVGIVATTLLFLAPIFYPVQFVPQAWRPWLDANPLTVPVEEGRRMCILGTTADWAAIGAYWIAAGVVAYAGFYWFQRTRRGFADVV